MPPALEKLKRHFGEIVDAQGIYHDLTKGAFDSEAIKHGTTHMGGIIKLVQDPLTEGIKKIAEKYGFDADKFESDDLKAWAKKLGSMTSWLGKKIGIGYGSEIAMAVAAPEATAVGTAGLVGVAIEAAVEWAVESWNKTKSQTVSFDHGEWLVIDKGQKTEKGLDRDIDLGYSIFGDMPDISEVHTLTRVEEYHVGFYVGPGQEEATITVFNILSGDQEQHVVTDVRKLPAGKKAALDVDDFASHVRELFFMKTDHVMVASKVSFDPGTEVIYDGWTWHIVSVEGEIALLENQFGVRESVSVDKLKRSRQERHGPAFVYKEGKPVLNSGFVTTGAGFGRGDWCWLSENPNFQLAVVHIIRGDEVFVYRGKDGKRVVTKPDLLRIATREDSDTFQRMRQFVRFKVAALEGRDVERLALPPTYRHLFERKDPEARHEFQPIVKPFPTAVKPAEREQDVANQETAGVVDEILETQGKYELPVDGDLFEGVIPAKEETDYGMWAGVPATSSGVTTVTTVTTDNTGLIVAGAVCLGAAAYYLS